MKRYVRLRTVAAAFLAALTLHTAPASAGLATDPALGGRLMRALAIPASGAFRSAAIAVDLRTNEVLFTQRGALSLAPASTEKLTLSYALLSALGPTYRIETQLLGQGQLEGSTWRGHLILRGQGDPTLATAGIRRLAAQVRAQGIRRVTGSVIGDETFFDSRRIAAGWKRSYYLDESPALSALVVDRTVYRGRLAYRPALAAAAKLRAELAAAGVVVARRSLQGEAEEDAVPLGNILSPPLLQMLRAVNRDSDNFTAELLLKHLGAVALGRGTSAGGAEAVTQILEASGIPLAGVRIVDGSGLSRLDRLTAEALVSLLASAWADPLLRGSFLASLAVAGQSGTLKHRLRWGAVRGKVFAKTGTTSIASTLAGYVAGRYAFAVLHNGPPLSSWWCRLAQDRFVSVLAGRP